MHEFEAVVAHVTAYLERVTQLNARYRAGDVHVHLPEALRDSTRPLEELV